MNYFTNYNELYTDYLSHHGILGQKWGIRRFQNKDGSLTNAGRERYLSGKAVEHKKNMDSCTKKQIELNKKAGEMLADWEKDYDDYSTIAGIAASLFYEENPTVAEMTDIVYSYRHADLDQGTLNSRTVYLKNNGLKDSALSLVKETVENSKKFEEEAKNYAKEILGKNADKTVNSTSSWTKANEMAWNLRREAFDDNDLNTWMLDEGCEGFWTRDRDQLDDSINRANKIIRKIPNAIDKNGAHDLTRAVEELRLEETKLSDMTDAQWKQINDRMLSYYKK